MNRKDPPTANGQRPKGFWPRARCAFRWFRIATLALVLFAAAMLLWCNYVSIPKAISGFVTTELRRKNIQVEFSGLRLQGFRRIVAQVLYLASSASNDLPRFDARAAELLFDLGKLKRGEIELSGLRLQQGRVIVPIQATNESPRFLIISNFVSEIDFLPGDTIRVGNVSAETLGAKAHVAGLIRNFSQYVVPARGSKGGESWERWKRELRGVMDISESLHFSEPPVISLRVSGDAADISGFRGSIHISASTAASDWGAFDRLEMAAGIFTTKTNAFVSGTFRFDVDGFRSPWGALAEGRVHGETTWTREMDQLVTNAVSISLTGVESRWGKANQVTASLISDRETGLDALQTIISIHASELKAENRALGASDFEATLNHTLPFPTPAAWLRTLLQGGMAERVSPAVSGDWKWQSRGIKLARSSFDSIQVSGGIVSSNLQLSTDPSAGFWRHLAPAKIPWRIEVSNVLSEEISIGALKAAGEWAWPRFAISEMEARLYGGKLSGSATLDVESRQGSVSGEGDFDYKKLAQLLDRPVQRWLEQFAWEVPPFIQANVGFELPEWTNSWESAEEEILPTISISGRVAGAASFREIPVQNAEGRFYFSNFVWRLPELLITRPEGNTLLDYTGNVTNGDFSCRIEARFDPGALQSLLSEEEREGFKLVRFPEPPWVVGEARGNWDRKEEITFNGRFAVTNLLVRGREITDVGGEMAYSNLVLECWNVSAHMGTGLVRAPYLRLDIPAQVMLVTNAVSTVDPYNAMFIVGPESYDAIDPYRFAIPPFVKVNGLVPLRHVSKADLWFEISGREFTFWKFHLPQLDGTVHWRGNELWITNVQTAFYHGQAKWEGYFLINPRKDNADFRFHGVATNADLQLLVADLFGQTNRMEGSFSGSLVVTSATSGDDKSWNGYGEASLRNGFLWSVPVFGVLTPVLDAIVPGAALSRVTSGTGDFTITNSVVYTRNMQVRTKAFRLNYKGSVDLEGTLDALVEAEILRDAWLVGKIFSVALWPVAKAFEAQISGTVTEPKTKLRYFPRFLFAPFKVLNELSRSNREKAPPAPLPQPE